MIPCVAAVWECGKVVSSYPSTVPSSISCSNFDPYLLRYWYRALVFVFSLSTQNTKYKSSHHHHRVEVSVFMDMGVNDQRVGGVTCKWR